MGKIKLTKEHKERLRKFFSSLTGLLTISDKDLEEFVEKWSENFGIPISDNYLEELISSMEKNIDNIKKLMILKRDKYAEKDEIGNDPNTIYSEHYAEALRKLSSEDLKFLKYLGVELQYDQIHQKGLMLNQAQDYKNAIMLYDIALKLDSSDSIAWFGKGNSLSGLDKFEEAIDCYDKMIALDPNFFYAYSNKALALMELDHFEEALQCIETAIKLKPDYSNLWSDKAKSLNHLERFKEAIVAAEEAIKLNNKNYWAWIEKTNSEMKLSNYSNALQSLDEAFKIDPQNSYALQLKEEIEIITGVKKADQLTKKFPKDAEVLLNKGGSFLKAGELKKALEYIDKVTKDFPNLGEGWSRKGILLSQMGKPEEGMKFVDKSIEIEPTNSKFLERKALLLTELGKFQEAIEYCDKALKNESNCEIALKLRSFCMMNIKQFFKEIPSKQFERGRILGKIINFLKENKGKAFTFTALSNRIEKILKDTVERDYCKRNLQNILKELGSKGSIKSVERNGIMHYFIPESQSPSESKQKDKDNLAEVFENNAISEKSNFSNWFEKGLACLNNKDYSTSIFSFKRCLEMKSDEAEVWYNIGIAYRKLGRSEYAVPCIERSLELNRKNNEALKMLEEISSEVFEQTMFGLYKDPISKVDIEEKGIRERSEALLDVFRPYIMLNNSFIKILGIESQIQGSDIKNKISIQLSGDLGGNMRFEGDIQHSLEKLDPSIRLTWVVHLKI